MCGGGGGGAGRVCVGMKGVLGCEAEMGGGGGAGMCWDEGGLRL